jgi:hypothetical protein
MTTKLKVFILTAICFCLPGVVYAQSGKEAYKALKKLEAKSQVGTDYRGYMDALGDANLELNLFAESKSAGASPELVESLKKALEHYKDAADLWKTIVDHPERTPDFFPNEKSDGKTDEQWHVNLVETARMMFKKYPAAYGKDPPRAGDAILSHRITLNDFLAIIWNEASGELSKAMKYIQS